MYYFDWHRHRFLLSFWLGVLASTAILGCGGAGTVNTPPPPSPDFSVGVQSTSASVTQGSSTNVTVTVTALNGFSGQVSLTISGFTSGLTAAPNQFVLSPGGTQVVTLSASSTATVGTAALTVAGQSGGLNHSAALSCVVNQTTVPVPDFSINVQPSSITVPQGSSVPVTITAPSVNNFSGLVNVTVSGFSTGISASQTQFSILSPGGQQIVSISAAASAPIGSLTVSVTGQSGTLTHSSPINGSVTAAQIGTHPSLRTNYIRDDAIWDSGFLSFFPQKWILYHPGTKRFFVNNTSLNRVEAYDATTETKVGQMTVPAPFVGDLSLDGTSIYIGTQSGDVYVIDPVAMTVTKRYPSVEIGPSGFATNEIRALADGRFALLGGQGGLPEIDGWNLIGIWNPSDNSVQEYSAGFSVAPGGSGPTPICSGMGNIGEFSLSADQTKILLGSADSDDTLCTFDPVSGNSKTAGTFQISIGVRALMTPPDGKEIIIPNQSIVTVYDSTGLFQTDQFTIGDGTTFYTYFLSADGNTLYAGPNGIGGDQMLAYNWRTHQLLGWVPTVEIPADFVSWVTPMAMDETGLMLGVTSRGLAFLDGGAPMTAGTGTSQVNGLITPNAGPTQGGTSVQTTGLINPAAGNGVFFGSTPATSVTPNPPNNVNAVSPAGAAGPVNVTVTTPSNLLLIPESFSYGPWVVEAVATGATAEGGGISSVFGYGFGPTGPSSTPANLTAQLGGQPVGILNYAPIAFAPNGYPFPQQSFDVTVPAGSPGASADLTLTDSYGSTTVSKSIQYLPAVEKFPLAGSVLIQGIYDPRRDVYYFTDQSAVQVFSKTLGKWLSPINMPHATAPATNRLWGISLSPDGSKLAISDSGTTLIYLVDPDSPGSVTSFVTPSAVASDTALPGGLAVTDSGIIYYSTFYLNTTGNWALHKLDTTTGTVTDYHTLQAGALGDDAATRVLLSNDNTRAYINLEGIVVELDTATDVMSSNPLIVQGDYELSLSSNQTWMTASEYETDTNLNVESFLVLNERETWNVSGVYGEKMSPDGNLLFSPLLNALDVYDGRTGTLRMRISLSIALSANYDALVSDGKDNVLVAITGQNGDGGVSVIDLSSLPEPPPSVFSSASKSSLVPLTEAVPTNRFKNSQSTFSLGDATVPRPQKNSVHRIFQNLLVPRTHQ
jgi:hypothetical protein